MVTTGKLKTLADRFVELCWHRSKEEYELTYWRKKSKVEGGKLRHGHYEKFYTTIFGLTLAGYSGKRVLDVGCGPRGSLEWADTALERIGLDPLALQYRDLGSRGHKMSYVAAASESIPFASGHFDIVTSFNSLDHVDDLQKTLGEFKRILKPGGWLLVIVEINHPPTPTEPLTLQRDLLDFLAPELTVEKQWTCALLPGTHDVYGSVAARISAGSPDDPAVLCAKLIRN